jgi:hypothetical protein
MNTTIQNPHSNYQDLLGRNIAARLNDATEDLPHDISERLKAARVQALGKRKLIKLQAATGSATHGSTIALNGGHLNGWNRLASVLPLLALLVGLLAIGIMQEQNRADEIADVDAELLTDDLPPAAFTDPGFLRFLNTQHQD